MRRLLRVRGSGRIPHQWGPLLPGDHRPLHGPAPPGRRGGRNGVYYADQGSHSRTPLPHSGPHLPNQGDLLLWEKRSPPRPHTGPHRRYVDRGWRELLPHSGGAGPQLPRGALPHYMIRITKQGRRDVATVECEFTPDAWSCRNDHLLQAVGDRLQQDLRTQLGFRMSCEFLEPFTLERSEGKTKRVLDQR